MSDWLNYHHLYYFWTVAREGSLVAAGRKLHVSHPTLSAQIRQLEEQLGEALFLRTGRKLVLTEVGRVVYHYAEEIFGLGREMVASIRHNPGSRPAALNVGVLDVLPKTVVKRLLEPVLDASPRPRVVCREGSLEELLRELAGHTLDLVLADRPLPRGTGVKAFSHLLGDCGTSFFGAPLGGRGRSRAFPELLRGAPLVLPLTGTAFRDALDQWLEEAGIQPEVAIECSDSALIKVLGAAGYGFFPAPSVVEQEVASQYRVEVVGRTEAVRARFYALSPERRLHNPLAIAITAGARTELFPPRSAG